MLGFKGGDVQGQLNAPLLQRLLDAGLRAKQVAGVSEGNPTPVEQLVYVRGEQQAVVTIQAFGVITLTPGLDVAGNQQGFVGDAGDSAGWFNLLDSLMEKALRALPSLI